HVDSTLFHDAFFGFSCVISSTYNCTCMSHCSTFRRCFTSDKSNNWFFISVFFNPSSSISLQLSTDLTDHDNTFSFWVIHQQFYSFFSSGSNDRVSSNTNSSGNSQSLFYYLISSFISQCSRF